MIAANVLATHQVILEETLAKFSQKTSLISYSGSKSTKDTFHQISILTIDIEETFITLDPAPQTISGPKSSTGA